MIVAGILDAGQEEQFIEYEITATQVC